MVMEDAARRIYYTEASPLYATLVTDRASATPLTDLVATAQTFKTSNSGYIPSLAALKSLFPKYNRIDDYLRTKQKNAVLADLKALIEGPDVLNQLISLYVAASTFSKWESQVWDNIFVNTILPKEHQVRTEEVRIIRLLHVIARIAASDPLLATGAGIYSVYMSTVLLPDTIFPLPKIPLSAEPVTEPSTNPVTGLIENMAKLQSAYDEVKEAFDQQIYEYKAKVYPKRDEADPDDSLQPNVIDHDPLTIQEDRVLNLSPDTLGELNKRNFLTEFLYMPHVHEKLGGELRKLGRQLSEAREKRSVVRVGSALIMMGNECVDQVITSPCQPYIFADQPIGAGHIRPIGIADLKVVQSQLYKYELGEVAHVENVLKGEIRKRTFRDLKRQEVTNEEESETTKQTERETQSTERFEIQQEASKVIQQDKSQEAGVELSASYGPVSLTANYGMASSSSQAEASSAATTYAKEVMERALERVIEKTRTRRSVTTIIESEDITEHGFDNTVTGAGGTDNVTGVYRWLDRVYYNKVVNYGRRMMFEIVIPEPAMFYLYSKLAKPSSSDVIQAPIPFTIRSFAEITETTYEEWAVSYGATTVKPPPNALISVEASTSFDPKPEPDAIWTTWVTKLTVPAGYTVHSARASILLSSGSGNYVTLSIGTKPHVTRYLSDEVVFTDLADASGDIPINMRCRSGHYAIAVQLLCKASTETHQQWQIDTFAALKTAYDQKMSEYNRWLNQQGVNAIIGNNPATNREVERKELKKHCIEFISGQRFESFDAMRTNVAPYGYPEFSFDEATKEGKYIQFFEQAFEWDQMTYLFYPYFWARKREWVNILQRDEKDPLFMNFLQAGAARVLVPVRNAYAKAILHYLNTGGEIWNGEDVPTPDDPLYVSIIDEIMEADGVFEGAEIEGEPWLSKVPTSLVYLTHAGTPDDLPDFSADLPLPE